MALFDTGPEAPTITAIAPWFGGKRTIAPTIVKEIGPHQVYWELCCGSLAVLFAKNPCREETVVDLHGDVTNLARVVASSQWWELCDRVERTRFSDELFEEAKTRLEAGTADELERAYDYLIVSWMGLNGVAGTAKSNSNFAVRYTSNGGSPAKRWRGVGESLPWWHKRLASVGILRRDIFAVAERIEDKAGTAIYVDPPYIEKSHRYEHDFEGETDHARLAGLLSRFTMTRVVVSYYDHPRIAEWYPNWTVVPVKATKGLVSSGMRDKSGATQAPEVLLINGASYA
jgi:DNA adenine methylase